MNKQVSRTIYELLKVALKYFCLHILKGKRAVAGYDSGAVKTWNLKTGACIHLFNAHRAPITAVDCHSDKDLVLSASIDNTASLLHAGTGQVGDMHLF